MVVLDTCALIEATQSTPAFSSQTTKLLEGEIHILSISFAEIACKMKLGKLKMNISVRELCQQYKQIAGVKIIGIGVNEWLESIDLIWPENKDPADRMITAYAARNDLYIVSSDNKMKDFYSKVIW